MQAQRRRIVGALPAMSRYAALNPGIFALTAAVALAFSRLLINHKREFLGRLSEKRVKKKAKLLSGPHLRNHNGLRPPFGAYVAPGRSYHASVAFFFILFSF